MEPKETMSREEEADEIIRRLKAPPRPRRFTANWTIHPVKELYNSTYNDELTQSMSTALAEEIDKEILRDLIGKYGN